MTRLSKHLYPEPVPAIRLSIAQLKTGWSVVGEYKIDKMIVPAHHEFSLLNRGQMISASWFELRDESEMVLYRRQFDPPHGMETHDGNVHGQADATDLVPPIQIIVPDFSQGVLVYMFSTEHLRPDPVTSNSAESKPVPFAVFKRTN